MKKSPWNAQLVFGLMVIGVGVLFVLHNLGMIYAGDYVRYWPVLLIIFGIAKLYEANSNKFWGGFFVVIGGLMLFDRLDMIDFHFWDLWPLALIAVGGAILWNSLTRRSVHTVVLSSDETASDESVLSLSAFLGGFEKKVTSPDFKGGNITTVMGGAELDLRNATIKGEEAVLDLFVVMGGVELRVPEHWVVTMKGIPVMGGFSDETRPPANAKTKRLVIQGTVVMGGVEIKN